jgi:hypothetical protein
MLYRKLHSGDDFGYFMFYGFVSAIKARWMGGGVMVQAVCHRSVTAESRIRARFNPRGICGVQWHWDRFFSEFFGFPLAISFHLRSPYSYIIWGMNNVSVSGSRSET